MPVFRARARTVDLLGRQQIAGIPTAISELFKNAHDAYAERVEADYFREKGMLVLRDDGLGMSPDDFVERWLTLGTESKAGSTRGLPPPPEISHRRRPVLGEKGIGRLAIASIGPQVLVLTRALQEGRLSALTFALINWRLFELPGVNLDQLDIPIVSLPGGKLPGRADLQRLVNAICTQIERLELDEKERAPILRDLARLDFDPQEVLSELGEPSLNGTGHGTEFIVVPTRAELAADIDRGEDKQAPPLVQTLIGFANTMLPDSPPPRVRTAFRDHQPDKIPRDLIAPSEFFTPEDFVAADHRVHGSFDELGDFRGSVHVYGGEARAYDFVWTKSERKPLACGPFPFDLAYVQGDSRDTRLAPTAHALVTGKLDRIGGLYIYRDDIRVLPYGTPGYDFLGIERRRTQNLSRAFFSYRRMFGVVRLNSAKNRALQEKAGREGFMHNVAYRQFRDLLSALFVDLAAEFFAKRGERSDEFEEGRAAVRERHKLRRERDARAERARDQFAARLAEVAAELRDGEPQRIAAAALDDLVRAVDQLGSDVDAADRLAVADTEARQQVETGRARFSLREPVGFGLTPDLRASWEDLQLELQALDATVWEPALQTVAAEVQRAGRDFVAGANGHERLLGNLERAAQTAGERTNRAAEELQDAEAQLGARVREDVQRSRAALAATAQGLKDEAAAVASLAMRDDDITDLQVELERRLRLVAEDGERSLRTLADRIERLATSNGSPADAETAVLEEELLELRERTGRDLELAQIGMATEILTHELDLTIVGIRAALDRLGARVDGRLVSIHNDLRTGFDHLDTYLALFTPLQRRLTRRRLLIKGSQIANFLRTLFARRLEDDAIDLEVTAAFEAWRGRGFRSTIYPVFVNLVDNATYWVTQQRPPRWIRLDADGDALIVADSGPGIPARDAEAIWQFGFTRKPGGRGAGLHISREILLRDGWELSLAPSQAGTVFRIQPPPNVWEGS